MYIVPIAWLYVALMMSVAEATNSNGTVLGAVITFLLYGVLPVGLILYFMGSPGRRRAIKARENAERDAARAASLHPDTSSLSPSNPVAPVRKEP
jgi:mannose/fructose/N-acetylgalactosamine-specific phosphotransferase system component IID